MQVYLRDMHSCGLYLRGFFSCLYITVSVGQQETEGERGEWHPANDPGGNRTWVSRVYGCQYIVPRNYHLVWIFYRSSTNQSQLKKLSFQISAERLNYILLSYLVWDIIFQCVIVLCLITQLFVFLDLSALMFPHKDSDLRSSVLGCRNM